MFVSEIKLYELLKSKIGEQEAKTLVEYVEGKIENEFDDKKDVFLTKDDKVEIIRTAKDDKVEIIRTVYIVGVVQYLAILASLVAIVKFLMV